MQSFRVSRARAAGAFRIAAASRHTRVGPRYMHMHMHMHMTCTCMSCHVGGEVALTASLHDQVITENPASRGTETSAEGLVGPPGLVVSNAGRLTAVVLGRLTLTLGGGPRNPPAR